MTGPDLRSADWAPFVTAVAEHQIRTERETAFLRDVTEIEQDIAGLPAFHQALGDDSIPAEELAALAKALPGHGFEVPHRSRTGIQ